MFGIDDAIAAVSKLADDAITRVWPDATASEKAKIEAVTAAMEAQTSLILGQLKINEVEAASPSLFVAGGRPAMIWVGVATLLYAGIGVSLLGWVAGMLGYPSPPIIDDSSTNDILMALLGVAGMRSYDKQKGTDTKQIGKK